MIDIVFLFLILYFMVSGLQKGFFSYLMEFLLVFVCVLGSWLYYKETHNLLYSLIILFLSPIILASIFKFLFHVNMEKAQHIKSPTISHLNNIAGGTIGFSWGVLWLVVISLVVNLIPLDKPVFLKLKDNVSNSYVLRFVKTIIPFKEVFVLDKLNSLGEIMRDPNALANLRQIPSFLVFMEDKKIQDFMKDRNALRQLQEKKILSLLDNSKFKAILEDAKVLKKFTQIDFESLAKYRIKPIAQP